MNNFQLIPLLVGVPILIMALFMIDSLYPCEDIEDPNWLEKCNIQKTNTLGFAVIGWIIITVGMIAMLRDPFVEEIKESEK